MLILKRIYEPYSKSDGYRILVDRLWPRGISKEKAKLDIWLKDIAPSTELRKWFNHDPRKWTDFKKKYKTELEDKREYLKEIKKADKEHKVVTVLYGAKDEEHNEAVVILEVLKNM